MLEMPRKEAARIRYNHEIDVYSVTYWGRTLISWISLLCCSHRVLRLSSGIDVIGPVMWDLALCLLLAWVIAFLCMVRGIKTTGKVIGIFHGRVDCDLSFVIYWMTSASKLGHVLALAPCQVVMMIVEEKRVVLGVNLGRPIVTN